MKKLYKNILLFVSMPLACMCTKNNVMPEPGQGEKVTIEVSIPETKVAITAGSEQGDPALKLAWEQNDQIVIKGTTESVFTVEKISEDGHMATFTGDAVEGTSFTVYYPSKDILSRSYEDQVQDGNASTAHLQYNAIAEGLSDYKDVHFNQVNGAAKIVVKLPEAVTSVSSLSMTAQDASKNPKTVFYKTNDANGEKTSTIKLSFSEGTAPEGNVLTAYVMVSWNEVSLEKDSRLLFELQAGACYYQKAVKLSEDTAVKGGETFIVDMSEASAMVHVMKGSGTESDPYLICDVNALKQMDDRLAENKVTYFKLMADIDMTGVTDWTASNGTGTFNKGINFDGNNHIISNFTFNKSGVYAGFIGVLYGEVKNLTFDNANVTGSKAAGVVCGYAGTGSYVGNITNVTIKNSKVTQTAANHTGLLFGTNGVAGTYTNCHTEGTVEVASTAAVSKTGTATGGIAGSSTASTFLKCSFKGTINGVRLCGGIVGYERGAGAQITECWTDATINVARQNSIASEDAGGIVGFIQGGSVANCYSKGSLTVTDQVAGGIIGEVSTSTTVNNCYSLMSFNAGRVVGGIVGRAAAGGWDTTKAKCLELHNCIYCGFTIDVSKATSGNGSSGAIVGYTTLNNRLYNSWRPAGSDWFKTGNTENYPADQPDCDGSWVKGTTPQVGTGTSPQQYLFPYWGKAAADGATVKSIVVDKSLGWDANVWDLTKDYPTLKNNPEPAE